MTRLNNAVAQEIARLKEAAKQLPELAEDYQEQAFGVFALWMNLAGHQDDDENEEIAQMRDFCTRWKK